MYTILMYRYVHKHIMLLYIVNNFSYDVCMYNILMNRYVHKHIMLLYIVNNFLYDVCTPS